ESAVPRIEHAECGFDHRIHYSCIELAARRLKNFSLGHGFFQSLRRRIHFLSSRLERFRHAQQNAFESWPSHRVFRRKIRSAEKWFAFRSKERRERPAALPRNRA